MFPEGGNLTVVKKFSSQKDGGLFQLFFWLKVLWQKSPSFVFVSLAVIPTSVVISLLTAYLPSALVDDITAQRSLAEVLKTLGLTGGLLTALYVLQDWLRSTQQLKNRRICQNNALPLIQSAMTAEYSRIEHPDFQSEFMKLQQLHLWEDVYTLRFLKAFSETAIAVVSLVLFTGMLSGLSPLILLLIVAASLFSYATGAWCNRWENEHRHTWWALDLKMEYLARNLSSYKAAKDVHLYHMAPWLKKLYDRELKERLHYTVQMQAIYYLWGAAYAVSWLLFNVASYFYLIYCVWTGTIDVPTFLLYLGILNQFLQNCYRLVHNIKSLHEEALYVGEHRALAQRLRAEEETGKIPLVLLDGQLPCIEFRNVSFQYEGSDVPVIRNLNLTIRPGENLALVGLNGAGKTTFIKLLCGFYDPTEGQILADGVDRTRYTRESWFRCFSGVFQETGFFPLSLEENLAPESLPKTASEKARLQECLRLAGLSRKLDSLPDGLKTLYGAGILGGAADFSGGEIQKFLLARSLYKRAGVLVLDEPTAALDPLAESELYETYHRLSRGKTTVFISHRLASTRFCDRILLMENGEIAEAGTHEELLAKGESYARMYRIQSKYYQQAQAGLEGDMIL